MFEGSLGASERRLLAEYRKEVHLRVGGNSTSCHRRAEGLTHFRTCSGKRSLGRRKPRIEGDGGLHARRELSSGRPGHHHIDIPALASGTDQPLTPVEDRSVRTVSSSHLRWVGLNLMLAAFAASDRPQRQLRGTSAGPWYGFNRADAFWLP